MHLDLAIDITEDNKEQFDNFCKYLITYIQEYNLSGSSRIEAFATIWSNYLQKCAKDKSLDVGNDITFQEVMQEYFNNLEFVQIDDGYRITCPQEKLYKNTSLPIATLAALINYGCIELGGYPYIDNVFEYVAGRIPDVYAMYTARSTNVS